MATCPEKQLAYYPDSRAPEPDGPLFHAVLFLNCGGVPEMTYLSKSPWLLHYNASSCNGCDIEILACLTPMYDVERFGIVNTGNPKHADIFVVTGTVNEQNKYVIKNIYDQMPDPKVVVAIGICATSRGIFRECYNVAGGIDTTIPVDVYVPGCAARPESIIDGIVKALGILEEKRTAMMSGVPREQPAPAVTGEKPVGVQ